MPRSATGLFLSLTLILAACGGDIDYDAACVQGATCTCPDGTSGSQLCEPDSCACGQTPDTLDDSDAIADDSGIDEETGESDADAVDQGDQNTFDEDLGESDPDETDAEEDPETSEPDEMDDPDTVDSDTGDSPAADVLVLNGAVGANDTLVCFRFGTWEFQSMDTLRFGEHTRFEWSELGEVEVLFLPNKNVDEDCTTASDDIVRYGFELADGDQAVVTLTGVYGGDVLRSNALVNQMPVSGDDERGVRFANLLADFTDVSVSAATVNDTFAPIPLGTTAAENVLEVPNHIGLQVVFDLPELRTLGFSLLGDGDDCITVLIGAFADEHRQEGPPSLISICRGGVSAKVPLDPEVYLVNAIEDLRDQNGSFTGLTLDLLTDSPRIAYGAMSESIWVSDELDDITGSAGLRPVDAVDLLNLELTKGRRYLVVIGGTNERPLQTVVPADALTDDGSNAAAAVINASASAEVVFELAVESDRITGSVNRNEFQTRDHVNIFEGLEVETLEVESAWTLDADSRGLFLVVAGLARPEPGAGDFDLFMVEVGANSDWTIETPDRTKGTIWVRTVNALMEDTPITSDFHPGEDIHRNSATDWSPWPWPDSDALADLGTIGSGDPPESGDIVTSIFRGTLAFGDEAFSESVASFVEDQWDDISAVTFLPGVDYADDISFSVFGLNYYTRFSGSGELDGIAKTHLLDLPEVIHPSIGAFGWNFTLFASCVEANEGRCLGLDELAGADFYFVLTGRIDDHVAGPPTLLVVGRDGVLDAAPPDVDLRLFNAYAENIGLVTVLEDLDSWDSYEPEYPGIGDGGLRLRPDFEYDFSLVHVSTENVAGSVTTMLQPDIPNFLMAAYQGDDVTPLFYLLDGTAGAADRSFRFVNLSYAATADAVKMYSGGETGGWSQLSTIAFGGEFLSSLSTDTRIGFGPESQALPLLANLTVQDRIWPRLFVSYGGPATCGDGFGVIEVTFDSLEETVFTCGE